jgi:molybdopterin molybdotransferase
MDGYALRAADAASTGARLAVEEVIYAGASPKRTLTPGTCARIMTGAPLPPGADAVMMQERTRTHEGRGRFGEVELLETARPGQAVRARGEDALAGAELLPAGTPLGLPEASLLWAQGMTTVEVPRRPRVAILSTGDELRELGEAREDQLVDTNSLMLAAAVERAGGRPTRLGIAPDRLEAVEALLGKATGFDLVLTSAGVSVGERDFVREAMTRLGVQSEFWRVALKPGKPLAVGRRDQTVFIGLPGNPTSSLVTFELFVRPALLRWLGHREVLPVPVPGHAGAAYRKAAGLVHFVRVTARWEDGRLVARPLASQTSGALRSAASATHLMRIAKGMTTLAEGDPVELLPVSWTAA